MTIEALIEKLRQAEAGSWDLDSEIAVAIQCTARCRPEAGERLCLDQFKNVELRDAQGELIMIPQSFRYTSSVDATIELAEMALPGHHWSVSRQCEYPALAGRDHKFAAFVGDYGTPKRAEGSTPALTSRTPRTAARQTR